MPGEQIMIPKGSYPELQGLADGDRVNLNISGVVSGGDEGNLGIQTESVEVEVDDAAQFQKKMSHQPAMEKRYEEEDEEI